MVLEINGKVIIVTGASEGIGLAASKLLNSKGAKIVLAARSFDKLQNIEKELNGSMAVKTDIRKINDIKNLISKTLEKFGRIDILINNAGQGIFGPVEKLDLDLYKDVFELNVVGVINTMQQAIPVMRAQGGGMIVNISSRVSKNYFPMLAGYASTKYALNAISLTARQELAKDNIIVGVVHPKLTTTNFQKNYINYEEEKFNWGNRTGMEADTPEEVAQKICDSIITEVPEIEL